jgi:hypothetical protein
MQFRAFAQLAYAFGMQGRGDGFRGVGFDYIPVEERGNLFPALELQHRVLLNSHALHPFKN